MSSQSSKDSFLQLQQKHIHYRSEISRLNLLLEDYKKKLNLMKRNYESLQEQLHSTEREKQEALLKTIVQPIAFFNYSIILPEHTNDENTTVLGNFIIRNYGNVPLSTPIICLRITPIDAGKLGGKIRFFPSKRNTDKLQVLEQTATEEWIFVNENWQDLVMNKGEYWLKANNKTVIYPNEQIQFSHFEFSINRKKTRSATVKGYAYFEQITEGIAALNEICIN